MQQADSLGKMLPQDNDTRWNSTCKMVKVVIEERERIELYMKLTDDMNDDSLTENDWADLKDLIELLEPFETISTLA